MRRIIAFDHVSADGYFADKDGNLNWVVPEDALNDHAIENMAHADTILFGRRTYEMFESYWPKAVADPKGVEDPHGAGRRTPALQKVAEWINDANKIVFSSTRKEVTWRNSRIEARLSAGDIETLKRAPGRDMLVFGSGTLTAALAQHGLIDEYQFAVAPVLLGQGRNLISGVRRTSKMALAESRALPQGNLLLRYVLAQ